MEFPYLVTRFLKWETARTGWLPAGWFFRHPAGAVPEPYSGHAGRGSRLPRILELASQIGEVDLRAGGRTVITPEAASLHLPREWATQGRYDIGMDRLAQKQEAIKRAYYLPMLELWSGHHGSMTATEVMARENERVLMFSPSFTLFVSDLYSTMARIFSLPVPHGQFPRPPRAVLRQGEDGTMQVGGPQGGLPVQNSPGAAAFAERRHGPQPAAPEHDDAGGSGSGRITWTGTPASASARWREPRSMLKPWADVQAMRRRRQALQQAAEQEPAGRRTHASP